MMDKSNILSRCLHGGPVPIDKMEIQIPELRSHYPLDKTEIQIPQGMVKQFLLKICKLYGSCAVLAYDDENVVGLLRFYPKVVLDLLDDNAGFRLDCVCIQQRKSMKKIIDSLEKFPSIDSSFNKTIEIECFQVVSHYHKGEAKDYGGMGISNNMLKELIEWAKLNDWDKIMARAINHITPLLLWAGMYSIKRYKNMGFRIVNEDIDTGLREGVISQRNGSHGKQIQGMWKEYNHVSNDEAARIFSVELSLR